MTITGRSFETVLERRVSTKTPVTDVSHTGIKTPWYIAAEKESDAAYLAARMVIGDFARYKSGVQILPAVDPAVSLLDAIPEVDLTLPADFVISAWSSSLSYSPGDLVGVSTTIYKATSLASNLNKPPAANPTYWDTLSSGVTMTWGAANRYEIPFKSLYATMLDLVNVNYRGIKAVRPAPGGSQVGIEIYNGANLTDTLVFDARFKQFDNATYLLSKRGSATTAYSYSSLGSTISARSAGLEGVSGLDRRVIPLDLTNEAVPLTPDLSNRGLVEIYKFNPTALFDGEIGEQIAAGYNSDYFLGDIIRLDGDYGLTENVRVVEFIRVSDSSGLKAYPAFEVIYE